MTKAQFLTQVTRLKNRFGERAFDPEFQSVIWAIVSEQAFGEFETMCSRFIGTRKHTNPPLEVDFREAFYALEKARFQADLEGATKRWIGPGGDLGSVATPAERREHLKGILKKHYGVETLSDAFEVALIRLKVARANGDPDPI